MHVVEVQFEGVCRPTVFSLIKRIYTQYSCRNLRGFLTNVSSFKQRWQFHSHLLLKTKMISTFSKIFPKSGTPCPSADAHDLDHDLEHYITADVIAISNWQ